MMLRMIDGCVRYSPIVPTGSPNAFTTWLLSSMSKGINVDSILPWSLYCFSWHRTLGMRKASMFANRQRGPCGCCSSCCWHALFHSTPHRWRDEVVASHDDDDDGMFPWFSLVASDLSTRCIISNAVPGESIPLNDVDMVVKSILVIRSLRQCFISSVMPWRKWW